MNPVFAGIGWGLFLSAVLSVALGLLIERRGRGGEPMYRTAFVLMVPVIGIAVVWLSTLWP